jgi:hypothetical protein
MGGRWRGIFCGFSMKLFILSTFSIEKNGAIWFAFIVLILALANCKSDSNQEFSKSIIACPGEISARTEFPKNAALYGNRYKDTLFLIDIGITLGYPADSTNPIFSDEVLEDWEVNEDGVYELISEYSQNRKNDFGKPEDICLRCDYSRFHGAENRAIRPVVLLQELPSNKDAKCVLNKDYKKKKVSAFCEFH